MLAERAIRGARVHDFDRYMNIPNDPSIKSVLGGGLIKPLFLLWQRWREIHWQSLHLGCSVEWMFRISGRIATWQRNRLRDSTISDLMMYKAAMNLKDLEMVLEEEKGLAVPEMLGKIPVEWEQYWCKRKLRRQVHSDMMRRFIEDTE